MENETVMAQTLLNDEEETDDLVVGEAHAEDEQADGADQVASSVLPVPAISSTFATSTIDIRLQIQPDDGHPDGRRIRNIIALNEKTLRIGALRASQLHALIALLHIKIAEQTMERFTHFLALLSEQQQAAAVRQTDSSAPQLVAPTAEASPAAALQAPLVGASPTMTKGEKTEGPDQRESLPVTTVSGNTAAVSHTSPPVALAGAAEKGSSSSETKPEQLVLF